MAWNDKLFQQAEKVVKQNFKILTKSRIMNPFNFSMLILVITVTTVLGAAIYDYRSRLIPNVITFAAMLTGLGLHSIHAGWSGLWFSLGGLALGGGMLLVFYLLGGIGAGDVKLLASVGALLGVEKVLAAFVLTVIAGGLMALAQIIRQYSFKNIFSRSKNLLHGFSYQKHFRLDDKADIPIENTLPYGVAIAIGTLLTCITK